MQYFRQILTRIPRSRILRFSLGLALLPSVAWAAPIIQDKMIIDMVTLGLGLLALWSWINYAAEMTEVNVFARLIPPMLITSATFLWTAHWIWAILIFLPFSYPLYIYLRLRYYRKLSLPDQDIFAWTLLHPWMLSTLCQLKSKQYRSQLKPEYIEFFQNPDPQFITYLSQTISAEILFPSRAQPQIPPTDYIHQLLNHNTRQLYCDPVLRLSSHVRPIWATHLEHSWTLYLASPAFNKHLEDYLFQTWVTRSHRKTSEA